MRITFLGTGTSHGVPSIDCMRNGFTQCSKGVCKAALTNSIDNRTRSSILVECSGKNILVDVSLDFRQQVLRERIKNIDAVCITHSHADHIGGMPDIRSYTTGDTAPLVVYGSEESMAAIRSSFAYIFDPNVFVGGGIPRIATKSVSGSFRLFDETITCLPVVHGGLTGATGYRIGNMAYIPDMKSLLPKTEDLLFGVKTLILNCLRETKPHASHLILSQSMELARKIAPEKCYFTHMSHEINAATDAEKLDPWMAFAYDGLVVQC